MPIGCPQITTVYVMTISNFIESLFLNLQKRRVKNLCLVTETVDESTKKYLCRSYQIIGEPEKIEIDEEGTVRKIGNFQKYTYLHSLKLNRSSRRKRGMASNPLFIIPDFFLHFPNELCYLLN